MEKKRVILTISGGIMRLKDRPLAKNDANAPLCDVTLTEYGLLQGQDTGDLFDCVIKDGYAELTFKDGFLEEKLAANTVPAVSPAKVKKKVSLNEKKDFSVFYARERCLKLLRGGEEPLPRFFRAPHGRLLSLILLSYEETLFTLTGPESGISYEFAIKKGDLAGDVAELFYRCERENRGAVPEPVAKRVLAVIGNSFVSEVWNEA